MSTYYSRCLSFLELVALSMVCIFMTFVSHVYAEAVSHPDKAFSTYSQGEEAQSADARQKDFNDALSVYLDLLNQGESGPLYYNVGNCYYQMGQYGLSIYYYYKAKALMPRNEKVATNLKIALAKVGLQPEPTSWLDKYVLFFYRKLSTYEKSLWAIGCFMLTFFLLSFYIWLSVKTFLHFAMVSCFFGLILYVSLVWQTYFISPQAVVIRTSSLYRGPGTEYVTLAQPCLAGIKATVIQISGEGNWLKIQAPGIEEGYISKDNARVL